MSAKRSLEVHAEARLNVAAEQACGKELPACGPFARDLAQLEVPAGAHVGVEQPEVVLCVQPQAGGTHRNVFRVVIAAIGALRLERVVAEAKVAAREQDQAFKEGMKPLRLGGAMKVAAGLTTIDEVLQTAPPPSGDRRQQPR